MAEQKFFCSLAYLVAAPVSALIIGATLQHAYCSRDVSLQCRWVNNAVAFLALAFTMIIFHENYAGILPSGADVLGNLDRPTAAQVLTPANMGCVQFLIQVYYVQQLLKEFGKTALIIFSLIVCGMNFLVSWGCALVILIKLTKSPEEVIDLSKSGSPNFQMESPVLGAWLATSLLAELVIVGGNVYARRSTRISEEDKPVRLLRYDRIFTKIAVATLQTSACSALLILVAATIFLAHTLTGDNATPGMTGCFVFLNLMRTPVGYASLSFSLARDRELSINAIRKSLMANSNSSLTEFSLEEGKMSNPVNQVTVHTVTSQVFEN